MMNPKRVKRIGSWRARIMALLVVIGCVTMLPMRAFAAADKVAQSASAVAHVSQQGDTLPAFARTAGVNVQLIATGTGIANPNRVAFSRVVTAPPDEGKACRFVHKVVSGDSLSSLARRYGTTAAKIQKANGITNPNYLVIGKKLCIP